MHSQSAGIPLPEHSDRVETCRERAESALEAKRSLTSKLGRPGWPARFAGLRFGLHQVRHRRLRRWCFLRDDLRADAMGEQLLIRTR